MKRAKFLKKGGRTHLQSHNIALPYKLVNSRLAAIASVICRHILPPPSLDNTSKSSVAFFFILFSTSVSSLPSTLSITPAYQNSRPHVNFTVTSPQPFSSMLVVCHSPSRTCPLFYPFIKPFFIQYCTVHPFFPCIAHSPFSRSKHACYRPNSCIYFHRPVKSFSPVKICSCLSLLHLLSTGY